jgi:hypothetical protein
MLNRHLEDFSVMRRTDEQREPVERFVPYHEFPALAPIRSTKGNKTQNSGF